MSLMLMLLGCCFVAAVANAMSRHALRAQESWEANPSDEPTDKNPYGTPPGPVFRRAAQALFWIAVACGLVLSVAWTLGVR